MDIQVLIRGAWFRFCKNPLFSDMVPFRFEISMVKYPNINIFMLSARSEHLFLVHICFPNHIYIYILWACCVMYYGMYYESKGTVY